MPLAFTYARRMATMIQQRNETVNKLLRKVGVLRFAAAVTYVEREVFGLRDEYMICTPDEKAGRFWLDEILQMGNFGQNDKRFQLKNEDSHLKRFWQISISKWRFIDHFPNEAGKPPIQRKVG